MSQMRLGIFGPLICSLGGRGTARGLFPKGRHTPSRTMRHFVPWPGLSRPRSTFFTSEARFQRNLRLVIQSRNRFWGVGRSACSTGRLGAEANGQVKLRSTSAGTGWLYPSQRGILRPSKGFRLSLAAILLPCKGLTGRGMLVRDSGDAAALTAGAACGLRSNFRRRSVGRPTMCQHSQTHNKSKSHRSSIHPRTPTSYGGLHASLRSNFGTNGFRIGVLPSSILDCEEVLLD